MGSANKPIKGVDLVMKSINQVIGGGQGLFKGFFELQEYFEEYLSKEHAQFIKILSVIEDALPKISYPYAGIGRRPYQYQPFIRAFFALCYFSIANTKMLVKTLLSDPNLRQLCGFRKVPSESTFSRRLHDLSEWDVMAETFDRIVINAFKDTLVTNISRDSTAIEAREQPVGNILKQRKKSPKKRGRPRKGTKKPEKEPSVLEQQINQKPKEIVEHLNKQCAWGCKINSQGKIFYWKGYKLHLDVDERGFPISACITGANVHDSQVAIALEKMTEQKITHIYSIMDSAYDAAAIKEFIKSRKRIPLIEPNQRRGTKLLVLNKSERKRYKIRSCSERANSHLKNRLFPARLFVKGYTKISFMLMTGVICLAALKHLQYFLG